MFLDIYIDIIWAGPLWAPLGPLWAGPLWAPWALLGRALMGRALMGPALMGRALMGPALMGRDLMGRALMGPALMGRALMAPALMGQALTLAYVSIIFGNSCLNVSKMKQSQRPHDILAACLNVSKRV